MPEIEADTPVADPAHESMNAAARFELDDDRFTETGQQIGFDHRYALRNIDAPNWITLVPKGDHGLVDKVGVARLAALFDITSSRPMDRHAGKGHMLGRHDETPGFGHPHDRNGLLKY